MSDINSYKLSREWFDFVLDNPDRVTGNHTALYMWIIEINNRCQWREKFNVTSKECMDGMSAKSRSTYSKCFQDLIEWGFVIIVVKSQNQHQCNVISLYKNYTSTSTTTNASTSTTTSQSTEQSQVNHLDYSKTDKQSKKNKIKKDYTDDFEKFWDMYPVKTSKEKSFEKWSKLSDSDKTKIMETLPAFKKYKPFDDYNHPYPLTYLNQGRWNDEIAQLPQSKTGLDTPKIYVAPKQATIDHSTLN